MSSDQPQPFRLFQSASTRTRVSADERSLQLGSLDPPEPRLAEDVEVDPLTFKSGPLTRADFHHCFGSESAGSAGGRFSRMNCS